MSEKAKSSRSLNLHDAEAHRLARAIAELTGETVSQAVTEALRERYERLQDRHGKASVEELLGIASCCAAHIKGHHLDHAELLYDERGLSEGLTAVPALSREVS
jgi:antitoxin VapB